MRTPVWNKALRRGSLLAGEQDRVRGQARSHTLATTCLLLALCSPAALHAAEATPEDTTLRYPAEFFTQWSPVTVRDMIDRIPGITVSLEAPTGNQNQRGLSATENILINGRRLSGRDNNAETQLRRIPFDQVERIEVIRGTSSDLVGVRSTGQVINIVTRSSSQRSLTVETSATRYQDAHVEPGGSLSLIGSANALEYRLGLERRSEYLALHSREDSLHGTGNFGPNDLRLTQEVTDQVNLNLNGAFSYTLTPDSVLAVNVQAEQSDPPRHIERFIRDFNSRPALDSRERELYDATRDSWELGVNFNHGFADGSQLELLTVNNRRVEDSLRERFRLDVRPGTDQQDLALDTATVNAERIVRGVYSRPLRAGQDVEVGLQRALTSLDTVLQLSQLQGGVLRRVAVPNANSLIEEERYEGFVVHHWQITPKLRLESTLAVEQSTIRQSGDVARSRDFRFTKPKADLRYDYSNALQFSLGVEKVIGQLRFADFAAATDQRDEERNTIAGNPELKQDQTWRYTLGVEQRLLQGRLVLSARGQYWDVTDATGRIETTVPGGPLTSANGNIGDGEVLSLQLNGSYRVTQGLLVNVSVLARASETRDPFTGETRRLVPNDRGNYRVTVRHDLPQWNLSYGIDYLGADQGNRPLPDIDRWEELDQREDLSLFLERNSLTALNLALRLELGNVQDVHECVNRTRYAGHIRNGVIREIEHRCNARGPQVALKLRGTF
jgi:outer membrane receptor for ferrienterochelin and colicins